AAGSGVSFLPFAIIRARQQPLPPVTKKDVVQLIASAIAGVTINQLGFVLSVSLTSVAHSSLVFALTPMLVLIAAAIFGQVRAKLGQFAGMGVSLTGVALLQTGVGGGGEASALGDVVAFVSACGFALYAVRSKHLAEKFDSYVLNAAMFATGSLGMLPAVLWD